MPSMNGSICRSSQVSRGRGRPRMKRPQIIGVRVSEMTAEMMMAKVSVQANSRSTRPIMPPMNRSGMNAAISDRLMDTMVKPIWREPVERRLQRFHPRLHVAVAVLDHDDGVVHHEADGDRQRQQRHVIEAVIGEPHQHHGARQRQRHGHPRRDGRHAAAQEHEHHQHHQQHAHRQRYSEVRACCCGSWWCGR